MPIPFPRSLSGPFLLFWIALLSLQLPSSAQIPSSTDIVASKPADGATVQAQFASNILRYKRFEGVQVDLATGEITGELPFHAPFAMKGRVSKDIQKVTVVYGLKRHMSELIGEHLQFSCSTQTPGFVRVYQDCMFLKEEIWNPQAKAGCDDICEYCAIAENKDFKECANVVSGTLVFSDTAGLLAGGKPVTLTDIDFDGGKLTGTFDGTLSGDNRVAGEFTGNFVRPAGGKSSPLTFPVNGDFDPSKNEIRANVCDVYPASKDACGCEPTCGAKPCKLNEPHCAARRFRSATWEVGIQSIQKENGKAKDVVLEYRNMFLGIEPLKANSEYWFVFFVERSDGKGDSVVETTLSKAIKGKLDEHLQGYEPDKKGNFTNSLQHTIDTPDKLNTEMTKGAVSYVLDNAGPIRSEIEHALINEENISRCFATQFASGLRASDLDFSPSFSAINASRIEQTKKVEGLLKTLKSQIAKQGLKDAIDFVIDVADDGKGLNPIGFAHVPKELAPVKKTVAFANDAKGSIADPRRIMRIEVYTEKFKLYQAQSDAYNGALRYLKTFKDDYDQVLAYYLFKMNGPTLEVRSKNDPKALVLLQDYRAYHLERNRLTRMEESIKAMERALWEFQSSETQLLVLKNAWSKNQLAIALESDEAKKAELAKAGVKLAAEMAELELKLQNLLAQFGYVVVKDFMTEISRLRAEHKIDAANLTTTLAKLRKRKKNAGIDSTATDPITEALKAHIQSIQKIQAGVDAALTEFKKLKQYPDQFSQIPAQLAKVYTRNNSGLELISSAGNSTFEYVTRSNYYISADIGLAAIYLPENDALDQVINRAITPYIGVNFNLFAINRDVHYSMFRPNERITWQRKRKGCLGPGLLGVLQGSSFMVGVTPFSLQNDLGRTNLFERTNGNTLPFNLLTGMGIRLNDRMRFSGGVCWSRFDRNLGVDIQGDTVINATGFFSLSIDWDLRRQLGPAYDYIESTNTLIPAKD